MLAGLLLLGVTGCPTLKSLRPPAPDAAVSVENYPVPIFAYQNQVEVKAEPKVLLDYFVRDLSWVAKAARGLQVEMTPEERAKDMSRLGESVDFFITLSGLRLPCRATTLKSVQDRDLWLMITSGQSWVLWRLTVEPAPDGSTIHSSLVGNPSAAMDRLINSFNLTEAGCKRFDQFLALAQVEFEPSLDIKSLTDRGLRGQVFHGFLEGSRVSGWIDLPPKQLAEELRQGPERANALIPLFHLTDDCFQQDEKVGRTLLDARHCSAGFHLGGQSSEAQIVHRGEWTGRGKADYHHDFWVVAEDMIIRLEMEIQVQSGGSRLTLLTGFELPAAEHPHAMELMMGINQWPGELKTRLETLAQSSLDPTPSPATGNRP